MHAAPVAPSSEPAALLRRRSLRRRASLPSTCIAGAWPPPDVTVDRLGCEWLNCSARPSALPLPIERLRVRSGAPAMPTSATVRPSAL